MCDNCVTVEAGAKASCIIIIGNKWVYQQCFKHSLISCAFIVLMIYLLAYVPPMFYIKQV